MGAEVIGTLYCTKGNFEFGISRIIKSLAPLLHKRLEVSEPGVALRKAGECWGEHTAVLALVWRLPSAAIRSRMIRRSASTPGIRVACEQHGSCLPLLVESENMTALFAFEADLLAQPPPVPSAEVLCQKVYAGLGRDPGKEHGRVSSLRSNCP